MEETGYFDGKDMAATFNALRPGDLFGDMLLIMFKEATCFVGYFTLEF